MGKSTIKHVQSYVCLPEGIISYHTFAYRSQTNRNSDGMWMQSVERWGERPNCWSFNDSNQPTKRQTVKIRSGKLTVCELENHNLSWLNNYGTSSFFMAKSTVNLQFSIANCQPLTEGTLNPLAHSPKSCPQRIWRIQRKSQKNHQFSSTQIVWIVGFSVF